MVPHAGPLTDIDISPDGSRLSLSIRAPGTFDVSMLQNVAAASKARK
jgi:hypothetical protein